MVAITQSGAIERMVGSFAGELNREAARAVLKWRLAEADKTRVAELSAKARAGSLSSDEAAELDWYLMLGDFLSIVHSKARVALADNDSTR